MTSIPGDCCSTGAVTGRISGLTVTLANPKSNSPNKLGTEIKAALFNTQNSKFRLCGFDVSQEELVIIAVYNSAEFCRFENIAPDALATEAGKFVLLGSSKDGTDAHTLLAKRFSISRADSKTLGLSLAYGSGQVSCCNLLRPTLGSKYNEKELKELVSEYIRYFKGTKARGDYLYQNGLFSHFFNYAQYLIAQPVPRLQFGGQAITNTLRPQNCGSDYFTSRINWGVQATGSYILDYLGYYIDKGIFDAGLEDFMYFSHSVHDELQYVVHESAIKAWSDIAKAAYRRVWTEFFASFRMACPQEVFDNLELVSDSAYRKSPNTDLCTASGKYFFYDLKPGLVIN